MDFGIKFFWSGLWASVIRNYSLHYYCQMESSSELRHGGLRLKVSAFLIILLLRLSRVSCTCSFRRLPCPLLYFVIFFLLLTISTLLSSLINNHFSSEKVNTLSMN